MEALYKIDGNDLVGMGFNIKSVSGIYDTPERKPNTEVDSIIKNGVQALTGVNDYYVKERQIVIDTILMASSVDDAITKLTALQTLLYTPGTRILNISYSKYVYECYCADGCDVKRLNSVHDNTIVYSVSIKLVEINPKAKIQRYPKEIGDDYYGVLMLDQAFYRNYEQSNILALADYVGRTQAIQTPFVAVEVGVGYIIIANVSVIDELETNPTNFILYNMTTTTQPEHGNRRVVSFERLGAYGGYVNCVKLTISTDIAASVDDKIGLINIFPNGIWRNPNLLIANNTGSWNATYIAGASSIWKRSDGKYCIIVDGHNKTNAPRFRQHLLTADSLDGAWTDQNAGSENLFGVTEVPAGFIGTWVHIGTVNYEAGKYAAATILVNASNSPTTPAIAMWNEDMTERSVIALTHDYVFSLAFGIWVSLTYYKGKYYYSFQDGNWDSGKRVVLSCDTLTGTFTYHSTVYNRADWLPNINSGCMFNGSFANGTLFTIGNRMYFSAPGENWDNHEAGEHWNHCVFLWVYDDLSNTWSYLRGPIMTAIHGFGAAMGFNYDLWDHMGYVSGYFVEDNKLWFNTTMNRGTDTYSLINGYIDVLKYLQVL